MNEKYYLLFEILLWIKFVVKAIMLFKIINN
jgi:hypothetical protein